MGQIMNYSELEQSAYLAGNIELANAMARIIELEAEVEQLEQTISDTRTLDDWEKSYGPAKEYYDFFHGCFERLNGHYPCPSVTSDYDQSVIFDAITKGEGVTE